MLNVLAVFLESVPSLDKYIGNEDGNFFDVFEMVSVLIFTVEFALRVFSVSQDIEHKYSRWFYLFTFFGIVDMAAIFPYYIQQIILLSGGTVNAFVFRVFRVFRVLQLEHFVEAFTLLDDVYRECKGVLQATGLLALVILIGSSCVFYITEQGNTNAEFLEHDAFKNVPDSLYYVSVFLGGEWGLVDFSVAGKIYSVFLCVMGIALWSVPIGTLFEGFETIINPDTKENKAIQAAKKEHKRLTKAKQTQVLKGSASVNSQ